MIHYYLELLNKPEMQLSTAEKAYLDIFPIIAGAVVLFVLWAVYTVGKAIVTRIRDERDPGWKCKVLSHRCISCVDKRRCKKWREHYGNECD